MISEVAFLKLLKEPQKLLVRYGWILYLLSCRQCYIRKRPSSPFNPARFDLVLAGTKISCKIDISPYAIKCVSGVMCDRVLTECSIVLQMARKRNLHRTDPKRLFSIQVTNGSFTYKFFKPLGLSERPSLSKRMRRRVRWQCGAVTS